MKLFYLFCLSCLFSTIMYEGWAISAKIEVNCEARKHKKKPQPIQGLRLSIILYDNQLTLKLSRSQHMRKTHRA
jgi:hypothetical protein